jgi:hypothetical protein
MKVQLIDIKGTIVFSKKFKDINNIEINTANFSDGIYFLNVSNRDYNKTFKIIKGNVLLDKADIIDSKQ